MDNTSFAFLRIELDKKTDKELHLDKVIDKKIRESFLSEDKKYILLNYPVVYIHTWKEIDGIHLYVGISKDLVQRTGQHSDGIDKGDSWKENWGNAIRNGGGISFVFSGTMMNKSLCLDLEHSLSRMLKKQEEKEKRIKLETIATTKQENYDNKHLRDDLLQIIWEKLRDYYKALDLEPYADAINDARLTKGKNSFSYPECLPELNCIDVILDPKTLVNDIGEKLQVLFKWPVVYMHIWVDDDKKCRTYVGETEDLLERTKQHLNPENGVHDDTWQNKKESWRNAVKNKKAAICVFGSPHFNESMILDIENKLIHYTIFLGTSVNGRTNEQKQYSNREKMLSLFKGIVTWLNNKRPDIFKTLEQVKDESVFMASPFLELTEEQKDAKDKILTVIEESLNEEKALVIVQGGAGTGKTVLASSLFFNFLEKGYSTRLIVNHKELYKLYNDMEMARKLGNDEKLKQQCIFEAQKAINNLPDSRLDVMIVDEAHLLYTQGHQGSIKTAQLPELQKHARVCVLMIDFAQFTNQGQYLKVEDFQNQGVKWIELTTQLRMPCCDTTKKWILSLREEDRIFPLEGNCADKKIIEICGDNKQIPPSKAFCFKDEKGYEIKIFDTPQFMEEELNRRRKDSKFCSTLATYDWEYSSDILPHTIPITVNGTEYCWIFFWHSTGNSATTTNVMWFVDNTTDVGAVHDIQGFDLDYAAVIIGKSVTFSNGKIRFNPQEHQGNITSVRTIGNEKIDLSHKLISNELYILLTRAKKGLYIYAVDDNLRNELIKAINN